MSFVRSSSFADLLRPSGLTDGECRSIHDVAYRLMVDDRSLGVGEVEEEGGGKNVFVLDIHGNRYTFARNVGTYLLFDPVFRIVAVSRQFDDVLEALGSRF